MFRLNQRKPGVVGVARPVFKIISKNGKWQTTTLCLILMGLLGSFIALSFVPWRSSSQFHTILEAVATCLAFVAGTMALVRFYSRKNNTFLFIGTGFVGTAMLDGYHGIVTSEFFQSQFPTAFETLIRWSWLASRVFLSVCLYLSLLAWQREERMGAKGRIGESAIYIGAGLLTMSCFLAFAFLPLPRAYYSEFFFHRPEEFIPAAFLFLALAGYLKKNLWRVDEFEVWLVMSLLVSFVAQALYMSRSGDLFDGMFMAAHFLKILSYALVITGLLASMFVTLRQTATQAQQLELINRELIREFRIRQKAQAELAVRADELARSNGELEQFAFIASHDLQEPLRKVASCCQVLKEDYSASLDEEANKWIEYAVDGAQRMQRLVADLLLYSRVGSAALPMTLVDTNQACQAAIENLRFAIEESQAKITCHPMPGVVADGSQLVQLLQNLVGNAIKYRGEEQPRIEIGFSSSTARAETTCSIHDSGRDVAGSPSKLDRPTVARDCHFYIRDNGIGIESKYFERIFAIFQRLHRKGEYSGTGIGLALCQKIVIRHGGRIWVESEPGKGSTFCFTLPLVQKNHDSGELLPDKTNRDTLREFPSLTATSLSNGMVNNV